MKRLHGQYDLPFEVLKGRRAGFSLTEVLTTIVIIVILTLVSLPAIDAFMDSMSSTGSVEAMVNAALSNARAMAITKQRYVGIRFQLAYNNSDPNNPFASDQYMTFIISEPGLMNISGFPVSYSYCAIKGFKPMKLPPNIAVMVDDIVSNADIDAPNEIFDKTTFTIIFSPAGNLIIRPVVHVLREGLTDEIFNASSTNPMFVDDYDNVLPFQSEPSRRSFVIYDKNEFKRAYEAGVPYSGYLQALMVKPICINPYTGTVISSD
jgi:prepilin-type N-terminal cleavage/methylation domain-containing protein